MQTGLSQNTLAQVWTLADYDKDGKLSQDEFIIAMHLCDFAKAGNTLPSTLPADLVPQRSRTSSLQQPGAASGALTVQPQLGQQANVAADGQAAGGQASSGNDSSPTLKAKQMAAAASFEDKRKENFDRGNAILEAKRQMLREQEDREKREREEKERIEQERKQKQREEQEKRRMAEIEKQMERQRLVDAQREEERRKAFEKQEAARNELLRQQRLEWEKQKKQELETQRLKLQELLSTLKARDKNLEYDMQSLNEKISTYKTKINDSQTTLSDLNSRLETTKRSYMSKQSEVETAEKQLRDYTMNMQRLAQEKFMLAEKQKNLNQDNPFAEEYRNDSSQLKQKQTAVQQLKTDLEKMEAQINATRTQLEIMKHELEVTKSDQADFIKENMRLEKLLEIKRANLNMPQSVSVTDFTSNVANVPPSSIGGVRVSQSSNNIRSATPKGNNSLILVYWL
jgi:intersectin